MNINRISKVLSAGAIALTFSLSVTISVSAKTPEYTFERNIPYHQQPQDEYAQKMCNLDIAYFPDGKDLPVVVWYHGGGLVGGNKEIPSQLLNDSLVVVGVEYRLSPNVTIDQILDDATASTAWVMNNIQNYGGDPSKIFLSGHSAGGYLVDLVAMDKSLLGTYGLDPDNLKGVIPFSGQCITHYEVRKHQGIPPLQPTIDRYAPLYHVRPDCPPMLIISADREKELYGRYEEQAYLWRMFKLVGHPDVTLYEMDGYDHGNMPIPGFPLLVQFIREHK